VFVLWPMAPMIVSHWTVKSLPSTGTGRRLPDRSGSPSSIWMQWRCLTPSSTVMAVGAVRNTISTPSSMASSISCGSAGISARVRRYRSWTFFAPLRTAVRTQSMAVLPPPMTTTVSPRGASTPFVTLSRYLIPSRTFWSFSPSRFSGVARHEPIAR